MLSVEMVVQRVMLNSPAGCTAMCQPAEDILKSENRSNPACCTWVLTVGDLVFPQAMHGGRRCFLHSGEEGEFSNTRITAVLCHELALIAEFQGRI